MRIPGLLKSALMITLIGCSIALPAQTKYWTGGSGSWADPARWSLTPGGSGGAGVPRASEDVVIAPVSAVRIELPAQAVCRDLHIDGQHAAVQVVGAISAELRISGAWGMNDQVLWEHRGDTRLVLRNGSAELDLRGIPLKGRLIMDGGGTWSVISDLVLHDDHPLVMRQGTLIGNANRLAFGTVLPEGRAAKRIIAGESVLMLDAEPSMPELLAVVDPGRSLLVVNGVPRDWGVSNAIDQRDVNVCGTGPGQTPFVVDAQLTTNFNGFGVRCRGQCNATVTVSVTGGVGPFTYQWLNGGPNSATWTTACGGPQIVIVTDVGQGISCPAQVQVSEPAPLGVIFFGAGTPPTCADVCNGSRTALAVGGVSPYSYNWNNGAGSSSSFFALCAGANTLRITDANNCVFDTTFVFNILPISPNLTFAPTSCFGECDGTAQVAPTGGTGALTITWSPAPPLGQGTTSVGGLCAGNYSVTIADANGCDTTVAFVIAEPPPILASVAAVNAVCASSCDGSAVVTVTSPGSFGFQWSPAPGGGQGTATATGLCQGSYSVRVIDLASGCDTLLQVTIDAPDPLAANALLQDASCADACDGTINVTISGGTAPYLYSWSPAPPVGQSTASVGGLCPGAWQVLVTDAVGCDTTLSYTIAAPPPLAPQVFVQDASCAGSCDGTATVSVGGGTPAYTYLWSPVPPVGQGTPAASGLCAGTYSVRVSDSNGCDTTLTVQVLEPLPLQASPTQTNVTCGGQCDGTATVAVNGGTPGYTYLWSPAPGSGQGTSAAGGLCPGAYSVLVTDANGCTLTVPFVILDAVPITLSLQLQPASCPGVCDGSAAVIAGGGLAPYTYQWTPSPGSGQGTATAGGLCAQAYTLTVTDALACDTTIAFTITEPLPILANATVTNASCANTCDGAITLSPTGGSGSFTYVWSPAPPTGQGTATASGLCAGSWQVTIASGGCDTTLVFQVVAPPPVVASVATTDLQCAGVCDGTATVSVSGGTPGYTYLWNPAPPVGQGTPNASGLCAGTFSVRVADANGCDTTLTFQIQEPLPLQASPAQTNVSCGGSCDGTASVTITGGTPGYTYFWSPVPGSGQGTANAGGLCPGNYSVLVTDANGCTLTVPFAILDAVPITLSLQLQAASCPGVCDGSAGVIAGGGQPPYTYQWSPAPGSGQGTPSAGGLCAQAYTLTVTDALGCDTTLAFTITEPAPIVVTSVVNDASCSDICDGSIALSAAGGTGAFTYVWSPSPSVGQGTATASGLCPGPWQVTITSGACDTTLVFQVLSPAPVVAVLTSVDASCAGVCDGAASVVVSGGTPGYTYLWTPAPASGQGTPSASGLCAGNYSLRVADASGCDTTITFVINEPLPLQAVPSQTNVTCGGQCDGTATVTVSGGSPAYTYQWTPAPATGQGTNVSGGLCPGTYTVQVTDANGCVITVPFTITDATPIALSLQVVPASCPNTCDGAAGVIASGGSGAYTYLWSPAPGAGQGSSAVTGLCAQAYTLTVTDALGCDTTIAFTVPSPTPVTANAVVTDATCAGGCNGSIALSPSGGSGSFSYVWSPIPPVGQGTPTASALCAGSWQVTITSGGCDTTLVFQVNEPPPINPLLTNTNLSCSGDCDGTASVVVSGGTPGYTYTWSPAPPLGQGTASVSGLCAGSYSLLLADANGCDTTLVFQVLENQPIAVDLVLTPSGCDSLCAGTATATITGGVAPYTLLWSPGNIAGQGTPSISGLCSGIYSLNVVDALGCDTTLTFVIAAPSGIVALPTVINASCNAACDGAASVTASGGFPPYSWNWSPAPPAGQGTPNVSGLCAGVYTLLITDAVACDTTLLITITQPAPLVLNGSFTNVSCNGPCDGTATVAPTGGTAPYAYQWTPAPPSGQGTPTISGLCPGTWTVLVTDVNGCSLAQSFEILDQQPILPGLVVTNELCAGVCDGTATATPSNGVAPFSYIWSPAPGAGQGTPSSTGLCPGNYTVRITDALGCDTVAAFTVEPAIPLSISVSTTNETCQAPCSGAATASVTGGTGTFTYLWQPQPGAGQGTATATGLCASTTYTLSVTDSNGCINTVQVNVQPFQPIVPNSSSTPTACSDNCTGTATVGPTGGAPPYTYQWSPEPLTGQGTPQATGLCAGVVEVLITDQNGCTAIASILITAPDPLNANASSTNISCAGSCDGSIALNVSGGTAPYAYTWSPAPPVGQGTPQATGLCPGTYSVVVTDANGCSLQQSFTITTPSPLVASTVDTPSQCLLCNGASQLILAGGTIPFSVLWRNSGGAVIGNSDNIQGVCAGVYSVTVTDGNGCTVQVPVIIPDADGEVLSTTDGVTACPNSCDGTVSVAFNCSEPPCVVEWTNDLGVPIGQSGTVAGGLCPGTYLAVVTNASGCVSIEPVTVVAPQGLTLAISSTPISCAGQCTGTATVGASGAPGPFTFSWSPAPATGQGTPFATGLCAGVYTIDVTDGAGCVTTGSVLILGPDELLASVIAQDISCAGQCDGAIDLGITGGTAPYAVQWLPSPPAGQGGISLSDLCAGTYLANVVDAQGCAVSASATIIEPTELVVLASSTPSTCPVCDGTVSVAISGGTAPFTVQWTLGGQPVGIGEDLSGLCGGLYVAVVTDASGCSQQVVVQVSDPVGTPIIAQDGQVSCANDCDGTVSVQVQCDAPPCVLAWTDANGNAVAGDTDTVTQLCPGTYTVQVTNGDGCVSFATASVSPSQVLIPNLSSVPASCADACDGSATVGPTGGVAPYDFFWSPGPITGQGTPQATGLCAGVYAVTISDASGCDTTVTVLIQEPSPLAISGVVQAVACASECSGSVQVLVTGGTAPYQYLWDPAPPVGQGTPQVSGLCVGTYTVTVSDAAGCVLQSTFSVTEPAPLELSATSTSSECGVCNGTAQVNATGGTAPYAFIWTLNGAILGATDSITGLCAGLYVLEVFDANGCERLIVVPVSDVDGETFTTLDGITTCPGDCDGAISIDLTCGEEPCSITWTDINGNDLGVSGTQVSGLCAGDYYVQVSNAIGCITIDTARVLSPDPILPNLSTTPVSCAGDCNGTATSGPTGGAGSYSFVWSPEPINGQGTPQVTDLCAGAYSLTITDADGCSVTTGVLITSPDPLAATTQVVPVACAGDCSGAVSLVTTGGTLPISIQWTPEPPNGQGTPTVTGLCAGTWTATVSDGNGCQIIVTAEVTQPDTLGVDLATTDATCAGACSGTVSATIMGGTAPFALVWNAPDGSVLATDVNTLSGLCEGTHTLTVTDAAGCSIVRTFTVGAPAPLDAALSVVGETCFGPCDGTATLNPSGGTVPYTIFWQPEPGGGQGTPSVTGLCAGSWQVTLADAAGCDTTFTFEVLPFQPIAANANVVDVSCGGTCTGAVFTTATGGTGGYTYAWVPVPPNGQGGTEATDLCAGNLTLTITDQSGCDSTFQFTITEPPILAISVDDVVAASCADALDGAISTTVQGGSAPLAIAWTGPNGYTSSQEDITALAPGVYQQIVTDANGCSVTISVTVDALSTLVADAGVDQEVCTGVGLVLDGSASQGAVTYQWTDAQGNVLGTTPVLDLGILPSGSYSFTLLIADGPCTATDRVDVVVRPLPIANAGPDRTILLSETTVLGGSPTGPQGATFSWSPDSLLNNGSLPNPIADPPTTTWFVLTVTGADGCVAVDSVLVTVVPEIVITNGFTPNGDGWNDTWVIDLIDLFPNCEVEIYNRWGEMLFRSVGYRTPWDGRYNGAQVPVGTYYYVVKLNDPKYPEAYTGPLTVIR